MLKIAYQMGVQQAFSEEDVDRLVKEAQELGIDLEKTAWLGALGKGLATGAKALGGGLSTMGRAAAGGLKAGRGMAQQTMAGGGKLLGRGGALSAGARGVGGQLGQAWKGMSPLQQKMMMGAGGAGLYAM